MYVYTHTDINITDEKEEEKTTSEIAIESSMIMVIVLRRVERRKVAYG